MKLLTKMREAKGWSKFDLSRKTKIHPASVGKFESGRLLPYPVELAKIAKALNFGGDPQTLLEEVESNGKE